MGYNTHNCDGLTGGGARDLDVHSIADLVDKDRAIASDAGKLLYFVYNATGTAVENIATHPYTVRPNDYVDAGTWEEQVTAFISDVVYGSSWDGVVDEAPSKNAVYDEMELRLKADAVITDNALVRGDGGSRGVQEATISVSDSGEMTNTSQPCFLVQPSVSSAALAVGVYTTVILDIEVFDVGNNFASNTFTAPVTGKYQINVSVRLTSMDTAATYYSVRVEASNRSFFMSLSPKLASDPQYWLFGSSYVLDMDASDTVTFTVMQSGGNSQTQISNQSRFSGALIC